MASRVLPAALRISGIVIGAFALVSLARSGLGIRFREDFLPLLELVDQFTWTVAWPFHALLVEPTIRVLRDFGFDLELRGHWHSVFVLLWLFNQSYSLAFAPVRRAHAGEFVRLGFRGGAFVALNWVWAALAALLGGALAGAVPLSDEAVFYWPVSAFFLFVSGRALLRTIFEEFAHWRPAAIAFVLSAILAVVALNWIALPIGSGDFAMVWWGIAAYWVYAFTLVATSSVKRSVRSLGQLALLAAAALVSVLPATGTLTLCGWLTGGNQSPSPSLVSLAAFIGFLGCIDAASAAFWTWGGGGTFLQYLSRVWNFHKTQSAVRILYVFSGAAFIIWAAREGAQFGW